MGGTEPRDGPTASKSWGAHVTQGWRLHEGFGGVQQWNNAPPYCPETTKSLFELNTHPVGPCHACIHSMHPCASMCING